MPPGPSVRDTRRSPPGDLPLDQLVQHSPAPHQPEQRPTNRVGTAAPSSLITTRPADGEMATFTVRSPCVAAELTRPFSSGLPPKLWRVAYSWWSLAFAGTLMPPGSGSW